MARVASTPPPDGQLYPPGQRVRIADDLGSSMAHFPKGVNGTVHHTYAHAYGGGNTKSYCIDIDGHGQVSWYEEHQLSPITATHPMTGLRRVILDAIRGCAIPPELVQWPRERGIKLFTFIGNQHSEAWAWDHEGMKFLPTDELMSLYDTLRPGVLDALGKGE